MHPPTQCHTLVMASECTIPADDEPCGITALGRCNTCRRAFCLTHQARDSSNYGTTTYVDLCSLCRVAAVAADKEASDRKAHHALEVRAESVRLINALVKTSLPGAVPRRRVEWSQPTMFRNRHEVYTNLPPAYLLGRLRTRVWGGEEDPTYHTDAEIGLLRSGQFVVYEGRDIWGSDIGWDHFSLEAGSIAPRQAAAWEPEEMLALLREAAKKLGASDW